MIQNRETAGVITTLLHPRIQNLPRIFGIWDRLKPGERVSDADIYYLPDSVSDATLATPVFHGNPELARVGVQWVTLYRGMTLKALGTECSLPV